MDVFNAYAFGTSGYIALQSLPLLVTPRLLVTLCASEPRGPTDLESYLARTLGLSLLTLAGLNLLLTGAVPLSTAAAAESPSKTDAEGSVNNPYSHPTLVVTTTYHACSAVYIYMQLAYGWNFAFTAGTVGSTALFCLGLWVILFGAEKGRVSKKTGADKRTSNFPFENKESAREKRREERREEREREKEREKESRGKRRSILRSSSYK